MNRTTRSFIASALVLSLAIPAAPACAEQLGTATALAGDRERIAAILARPEAQAQLQARGVDPAEAQARVAALTDEEAAQLAARIDPLPAGGEGGIGMAVTVGIYVVVIAVALAVMGVVALAKAISKSA
jgi:hypothetical protein